VDYGLTAQAAAEAHLLACREAMEQWEEAGEVTEAVESPASAPFCGCQTCEIREVLWAAWPILRQGVLDEMTLPLLTLDSLPDRVRAEAEDQDQAGSDQRQHHVLEGEVHGNAPPCR